MNDRFASIGQGTDRGRWREHNEDALRVAPSVLLVADGMGGHACGEVASQVAADATVAALTDEGRPLGDALAAAHAAVLRAAEDGRGAPGMGTTCVVCRLTDAGLEVAWVGDSRGYRLRTGRLEPLTRDHSEVQLLVNEGVLTPEQAARHPGRHMLARALGIAPLGRAEIDERTVPPATGDRILLCSDGLTGELDDEQIAAIVVRHPDDQEAVDALIGAALDAGGRDNVTAIVATVA